MGYLTRKKKTIARLCVVISRSPSFLDISKYSFSRNDQKDETYQSSFFFFALFLDNIGAFSGS